MRNFSLLLSKINVKIGGNKRTIYLRNFTSIFTLYSIFFLLSICEYHRYYRLWIYTCNAVLLMAVIIFCGVAGKVLLADYRRLLVNGLNLSQPSFIYAYLALLVQSGEQTRRALVITINYLSPSHSQVSYN
jgi:hypothetical protein